RCCIQASLLDDTLATARGGTPVRSRAMTANDKGGRSMELEGRKVAILAEDLYEDLELWYPYYRLKEAGAEVKVIGSGRADSFNSKHGYPVKPDLSVDQARAADFDAVVIPGG